jgi:hypothetical protein
MSPEFGLQKIKSVNRFRLIKELYTKKIRGDKFQYKQILEIDIRHVSKRV